LALKKKPPANQPLLVAMPSPDEPQAEQVILDPNQLDSKGSTAIEWYEGSPDGKWMAVSLSVGGSERGDLHLYETATGRETGDVIPRVQNGTAGGSLAWTPDGSSFYYTRYPRLGERPKADLEFYQELWFHQIGTTAKDDRYEMGKGFDRTSEIEVEVEPKSGLVLAQVQQGDSGRFAFYVRNQEGKWIPIANDQAEIVEAVFRPGGGLFLVSRKSAPRGKVLLLPDEKTPLSRAKVIIPEGKENIVTQFYHATSMLATPPRHNKIARMGSEGLPISQIMVLPQICFPEISIFLGGH
jgi:prolyl oligopeptidase